MSSSALSFAIAMALLVITSARSQVSLTTVGNAYNQDFDGLAATGTSNPWSDNSTIVGWYSNEITYIADGGTSMTGGLHSYGGAMERAMGALSSGSDTTLFGVRLVNNTGSGITSLDISFYGEQWRQTTNSHTLGFAYQIGAADISSGIWIAAAALDFTALHTGGTESLDGNDPANRLLISTTLPITLANGEEVWFRWEKAGTSSPGLAIDDLNITPQGTVGGTPVKLSIASINSSNSPSANEPFYLTVQSLDNSDLPANVTSNTAISLSLAIGTGTLGGNLSGIILAGTNNVTITGVTYTLAESGVKITASSTAGDALDPGNSAAFTVLEAANHLEFVNVPPGGQPLVALPPFTVEARRSDNSVDMNYPSEITIAVNSGPGNLIGTLGRMPVTGTSSFDDIQIDVSGAHTLSAAANAVTGATSGTITILSNTLPLYDPFNYSVGSTLTSYGWTAHSGAGQNSVTVVSGNLIYPDYPLSGEANSASIVGGSGSREDVNRPFAEQTSGSVYASFLVNVASAPTSGDYFFHLGPSPIGNTFRARVYIEEDVIGNLLFGVSKTGATVDYAPATFSFGTTYLIVVRYAYVGDATGTDDVVSLWINPSLAGPEPTPDVTNSDGSDSPIGSLALRQASAYSLQFDGIQIGTTWSDSPLPIQLLSFSGSSENGGNVVLEWTTLSELNNYGFYVQRRDEMHTGFSELPGAFVPGHGTTNIPQYYSYNDRTADRGRWYYRLRQEDFDGANHYSQAIPVDVVSSVDEQMPSTFMLQQNYPNPFNPTTAIRFSVDATGPTTLALYNLLGQEIRSMFNGNAEAGHIYIVTLDGSSLPSGMYFYRLLSGANIAFRRMLLLR